MTAVRYTGPAGQSNIEVGQATGEGDFLEPDGVYDLPSQLAKRLVETNAAWEYVRDFDTMTKRQALDLAGELEIEGRSKMTKDELVVAIREARERGVEAESATDDLGVATPTEATGEE